jgi:hypothetical protein
MPACVECIFYHTFLTCYNSLVFYQIKLTYSNPLLGQSLYKISNKSILRGSNNGQKAVNEVISYQISYSRNSCHCHVLLPMITSSDMQYFLCHLLLNTPSSRQSLPRCFLGSTELTRDLKLSHFP